MPPSERKPDEPISLAPLTPEEALRALLEVDPDAEPADTKDRDDQAKKDEADDK